MKALQVVDLLRIDGQSLLARNSTLARSRERFLGIGYDDHLLEYTRECRGGLVSLFDPMPEVKVR